MNESALSPRTVKQFGWVLAFTAGLLPPIGWVLLGIDFFLGVLLGSLIVILNVWWTKKLVETILYAEGTKALVTASYMVKLGFTGVGLYLALFWGGLPAAGLLLGLSSLFIAVLVFSGIRMVRAPRP